MMDWNDMEDELQCPPYYESYEDDVQEMSVTFDTRMAAEHFQRAKTVKYHKAKKGCKDQGEWHVPVTEEGAVGPERLIGCDIKCWLPLEGMTLNPDHVCEFVGTLLDFKPHPTIPDVNLFLMWGCAKGDQSKPVKGLQIVPLSPGDQKQSSLRKSQESDELVLRQWQMIFDEEDACEREVKAHSLRLFLNLDLLINEADPYVSLDLNCSQPCKLWPLEDCWAGGYYAYWPGIGMKYDDSVCVCNNPKTLFDDFLTENIADLVQPGHPSKLPLVVQEFVICPRDKHVAQVLEDTIKVWELACFDPVGLLMKTSDTILKERMWHFTFPPEEQDMQFIQNRFSTIERHELMSLLGWESDKSLPVPTSLFGLIPAENSKVFRVDKDMSIWPYTPFTNIDTKTLTTRSEKHFETSHENQFTIHKDSDTEHVNRVWKNLVKEIKLWEFTCIPGKTHGLFPRIHELADMLTHIRRTHLVPCCDKTGTQRHIKWTPLAQAGGSELMWRVIGVRTNTPKRVKAFSTFDIPNVRQRTTALGNAWLASQAAPHLRRQIRELIKRHESKKFASELKIIWVFFMFSGIGVQHILKHIMHDLKISNDYSVVLLYVEKESALREAVQTYALDDEQEQMFPKGTMGIQFKDVEQGGICFETSWVSDNFRATMNKAIMHYNRPCQKTKTAPLLNTTPSKKARKIKRTKTTPRQLKSRPQKKQSGKKVTQPVRKTTPANLKRLYTLMESISTKSLDQSLNSLLGKTAQPFWTRSASDFKAIEQVFGFKFNLVMTLLSPPCANVSANNHKAHERNAYGPSTGLKKYSDNWVIELTKYLE